MKVMKNRILYFLILFPFFLASSVTLHFVAPHLLSLFPEVNWLALALALLVILTPWGSIELSSSKSDQQPLAFKLWLFKILLLEIALMLIYFGFTQFNNVILPIHTTAHPTEFVSSLSTLLLHFGLYPWGLIGIFAISFGISSYIKNQDSYMCTIIQKEVNTKHEGLKSIFNTIPTIFTLVGFALTMVIITVIAAALLTPSHELKQITGFTSVAMVASLLMLLLAVRKKTSHLLVIAYKQRPAVGFIITLMIWTIVLAIIAVVAGHLFHDKPHTPAFVQSIFNKGWANYWQLFSSIWCR
jgi:hypothetical protein